MENAAKEMSRPTTAEPKEEKPVRGQHYLNKVQSLWTEASAKQESAAKPLTKEQKLRAMLGYQELADGQRNPVFWREGNLLLHSLLSEYAHNLFLLRNARFLWCLWYATFESRCVGYIPVLRKVSKSVTQSCSFAETIRTVGTSTISRDFIRIIW